MSALRKLWLCHSNLECGSKATAFGQPHNSTEAIHSFGPTLFPMTLDADHVRAAKAVALPQHSKFR